MLVLLLICLPQESWGQALEALLGQDGCRRFAFLPLHWSVQWFKVCDKVVLISMHGHMPGPATGMVGHLHHASMLSGLHAATLSHDIRHHDKGDHAHALHMMHFRAMLFLLASFLWVSF